ncbi:MAG: anhydro-N-acetylmuramic acid kinase [Candidatus Kapaibacterium sp.]
MIFIKSIFEQFMNKFQKILNKSERLIIGALSGTSVDAVDVVLARFTGRGDNVRIKVLQYNEYRIPADIKKFVLRVSSKETGYVDDVCRLNFLLGKFYADCINRFIKDNRINSDRVDAIGSHGQTIHHLPITEKFGNIKYKSTLQVGDPSVIANNTGITTIGDFRTADAGVMGSGAPLVPYLDFVLFRSETIDRIVLNIGGIGNLTYLPVKCDFNNVTAFDTGPGNMMIDYLTKKFFGKEYDKDCKISNRGIINEKVFKDILYADTYLKVKPPKSTGREFYNSSFIEDILKINKNVSNEDILRTFTEYTAFSVSENIRKYLKRKRKYELHVSGGGANNILIMNGLRKYNMNAEVSRVSNAGITTSNKEAVLFALLAHETLNMNCTNLKSVTGAKKNVVLGKICIA